MIRIISSRKFRLYSPDRKENVVTEGKNIIQELPDWAAKDEMFKVAKNAGYIQILSSRSLEKKAEETPEDLIPQNAHEEAPEGDPVQEEDFSEEEAQEETQEEVSVKKSRRKRK